jgi:DNA polymerase-3 subunit gamma/tau
MPAAAATSGGDVHAEWAQLKPTLRNIARAVYAAAELVGADGDAVTLAAPNTMHRAKCEEHRVDVQRAWSELAGRPITIVLVDRDDGPAAGAPAGRRAPVERPEPEPEDDIDLGELVDAPPGSVPTTLDRLAEAFPGSELIDRRD